MPKRVYPVPELIVGTGVRIEGTDEYTGSMDNESRIMRVPLMDTPNCRHIRAHEMAHAKYSPVKPLAPSDIQRVSLQRAEDMRMNVLCRRQGLDKAMDAPIVTASHIWERLLVNPLDIVTAGLSTFDTGDWPRFSSEIESYPANVRLNDLNPEDVKAFIASMYEEMKADPTFENTIRIARKTQEFVNPPDEEESPGDGDGSESEGDGSGDPSGDSSDSDGDSESDAPMERVDLTGDSLDQMIDSVVEAEAKHSSMSPYEFGLDRLQLCARTAESGDADIVPAKITVQKMPKRLPPNKFKSRAKVPADTGMVPKHMNRYCTDKAIFAGRGRKRSRGGTILIDASGSMAIHESKIDEIMEEVPLGTIASYSGNFEGGSGVGVVGDLYVIAKNGNRAIENLRPKGMMNLIDVPALEWMVKQDGPYYWVCDGYVTGGRPDRAGEKQSRNIADRCIEIVEANGIIMVPSLDALVKTIQGK